MKHDRINDIYESYVSNQEYNQKFLDFNVDLSFLEGKITAEQMLHLESVILSLVSKNDKAMFESGFTFAWELFQQCQALIRTEE